MGESFATTEEPDLVVWRIIGDVTAADIERMYDIQIAFSRGKPRVLVLVDVSRMKNMPTDARQAAARGPAEALPVRGIAVTGASFHLQVIGVMLNKASAMLHRVPEQPMRFFSTETEARAWLVERRRHVTSREMRTPLVLG